MSVEADCHASPDGKIGTVATRISKRTVKKPKTKQDDLTKTWSEVNNTEEMLRCV